ncbi:Eco57I restriction-modification methylase domain-containing protein [Chloroflexus sp.]|uniref:Eco57I restriction-modification methylase domain-containing protein n=1 Tax=Chloroflexus sp. TaxID=1904827 RepID=UPI002ACE4B84|nr:N-6 DNA methylase [Chloroflexus sp.]
MDHSLLTQLETIRQSQQHRFDSRTPAEQRNRRGQFATPPLLAREIARYLRMVAGDNLPNLSFADPALGSGSLYAAALAEFGAERIVSAIGIEIDEDRGSIARTIWAETGLRVVCGDCIAFITNDHSTPNLIIANPPYVRHHHLDPATKRRLQALTAQRTGIHVSGLAGLYVYVVLLSMAWLARSGYAAWLLPAEWMDVGYGAFSANKRH